MVRDDEPEPEPEPSVDEWGMSTDDEAFGEIDESGIMRDLDLLDPEPDNTSVEPIPRPPGRPPPVAQIQTLPPEALEDILFDDVTQDEDEDTGRPEALSGFDDDRDRPVVLLESPKSGKKGDRDFVDDLARRLESDEED